MCLLYFEPFRRLDTRQLHEIHSRGTLHLAYPTKSTPCLLMLWRCQDTGHQQAWCWPNKPEYSVLSIRRVDSQNWNIGIVAANASHFLNFLNLPIFLYCCLHILNCIRLSSYINNIPCHTTWLSIKHVLNTLRPWQNSRHFADDILNAFSWMTMFEFRLKFHSSLFLRFQLTTFQRPDNGLARTRRKPSSKPMMVCYLSIYASLGFKKFKT